MDYSKITIDDYRRMTIHEQLAYERWRTEQRELDKQHRKSEYEFNRIKKKKSTNTNI